MKKKELIMLPGPTNIPERVMRAMLKPTIDHKSARALTGKPINIKRPPFMEPQNVRFIIDKIESVGNQKILLTERGTCFGYYNIVSDFRVIPLMRAFGYPVIYDVSHSVRISGITSDNPLGGTPEFIPHLIRASVAVGCDGLFIETHPNVKKALCDSCSMWPLNKLEQILSQAKKIYDLLN